MTKHFSPEQQQRARDFSKTQLSRYVVTCVCQSCLPIRTHLICGLQSHICFIFQYLLQRYQVLSKPLISHGQECFNAIFCFEVNSLLLRKSQKMLSMAIVINHFYVCIYFFLLFTMCLHCCNLQLSKTFIILETYSLLTFINEEALAVAL